MPQILIFIICFLLPFFIFSSSAAAVCPVCTIAIGGGVLLSHYLGIDDLAVGVWVGGLTLALGLWMSTYIKKSFFKGQQWLLVAFLWITTVLGLKQAGFIGHPTCKIHGHDKLLVGIIAGTIAFLLGFVLDWVLRKYNQKQPGKALFPYQKVILPIVCLVIVTLIVLRICQII